MTRYHQQYGIASYGRTDGAGRATPYPAGEFAVGHGLPETNATEFTPPKAETTILLLNEIPPNEYARRDFLIDACILYRNLSRVRTLANNIDSFSESLNAVAYLDPAKGVDGDFYITIYVKDSIFFVII